MTATEYLKNKLKNLVIDFPNIKCVYEFDNSDNSHTIEISPSEFFNQSESFHKISFEIWNLRI
jgi:hypothetical protein